MNKVLCAALLWLVVSPLDVQAQTREGEMRDARPAVAVNVTSREEVRNEVARLLRSTVKKDQAWAAYLSGRYELKENVSSLVEMLERAARPDERDSETQYLMRAALDALIQLDAELSTASLQTLYARFPEETVVLLSNSTENIQPILLALMAETPAHKVRWLALGNLLARDRAPGFAALLLREMKIKVTVYVLTPGEGRGGGEGDSGGYGYGSCHPPEGFPPVASYTLTESAGRGAVVVAEGTRTVYYNRQFGHCSGEDHSEFLSENPDRYRLELLLAMLNLRPEDLKFDVAPWFDVEWKNAPQYTMEVRRIRRQVRESCEDLLRQLENAELLTPTEAETLKPNISYEILDCRADANPPLPDVADDPPDSSKQER